MEEKGRLGSWRGEEGGGEVAGGGRWCCRIGLVEKSKSVQLEIFSVALQVCVNYASPEDIYRRTEVISIYFGSRLPHLYRVHLMVHVNLLMMAPYSLMTPMLFYILLISLARFVLWIPPVSGPSNLADDSLITFHWLLNDRPTLRRLFDRAWI